MRRLIIKALVNAWHLRIKDDRFILEHAFTHSLMKDIATQLEKKASKKAKKPRQDD